jgi:uncharacterized protein (DUF1015 family)
MAEVKPLRALHYNLEQPGGLQDVIAPPYDVIDEREREELAARSPYNVVAIDLPRAGSDPYGSAAEQFLRWQREGVLLRDRQPAIWLLAQEYTGPDGVRRTRRGALARVRVEKYGAGTIRPHERTHPGPKEDRLRLTRATRANLSPIFSLYDDPANTVSDTLARLTERTLFGEAVEGDGTVDRLWRVDDEEAIEVVVRALAPAELLIADGHHRYETAREYAEEIGGEGPHRYTLMCLVAMQDPGLTVFPTHRVVNGLTPEQHEALANAIREDFEIEPLGETSKLEPGADGTVKIGYLDAHFKQPFMLTLKNPRIADAALPGHSSPYRRLDTAVLEALILKGALGMNDEQIDHLQGLGYARDAAEAVALVERADYDAAFFMAPTPIEQVRAVAAAGETMPPKSTYFFPKVPTGLVFNALTD